MGLFDLFKQQQGAIRGLIVPHGIRPHDKSIVSVCLFKVASADAPHPFGGSPPADAMTESVNIRGAGDLHDKELTFGINRAPGFYHIQVTYIAFFKQDGERIAQLERFFPIRVPVTVSAGKETTVQLDITWPDIPLEDLGTYGVFRPGQPFTPAHENDKSDPLNEGR